MENDIKQLLTETDVSALATASKQDDIIDIFKPRATKLLTSGDYTYCAQADPGSLETSAVWQVMRWDSANNVVEWADGNSNYDNQADDLASLNYS